jgi:hypothetical protein
MSQKAQLKVKRRKVSLPDTFRIPRDIGGRQIQV